MLTWLSHFGSDIFFASISPHENTSPPPHENKSPPPHVSKSRNDYEAGGVL